MPCCSRFWCAAAGQKKFQRFFGKWLREIERERERARESARARERERDRERERERERKRVCVR